MDWFLYDRGSRHEKVKQNINHPLSFKQNINLPLGFIYQIPLLIFFAQNDYKNYKGTLL